MFVLPNLTMHTPAFPLIQLPRKSEVLNEYLEKNAQVTVKFPLIQLPRKSEDFVPFSKLLEAFEFPLIQLPRKSEVDDILVCLRRPPRFH